MSKLKDGVEYIIVKDRISPITFKDKPVIFKPEDDKDGNIRMLAWVFDAEIIEKDDWDQRVAKFTSKA